MLSKIIKEQLVISILRYMYPSHIDMHSTVHVIHYKLGKTPPNRVMKEAIRAASVYVRLNKNDLLQQHMIRHVTSAEIYKFNLSTSNWDTMHIGNTVYKVCRMLIILLKRSVRTKKEAKTSFDKD